MATAPTAWRLLGRPTTSVVLSHLLDRCDVGLRGASLADRVGGNHACGRDDEHRLMAIITENSRSSTERPWIPSVPHTGAHLGTASHSQRVKRTVARGRLPNAHYRVREYLPEKEIDR